MTNTRIYVIVEQGGTQRLVEAATGAQAIRHCVRNKYSAKAANPRDVASLMATGITLERAENDQPAEQAKTEEQ